MNRRSFFALPAVVAMPQSDDAQLLASELIGAVTRITAFSNDGVETVAPGFIEALQRLETVFPHLVKAVKEGL